MVCIVCCARILVRWLGGCGNTARELRVFGATELICLLLRVIGGIKKGMGRHLELGGNNVWHSDTRDLWRPCDMSHGRYYGKRCLEVHGPFMVACAKCSLCFFLRLHECRLCCCSLRIRSWSVGHVTCLQGAEYEGICEIFFWRTSGSVGRR